jgi:hypothetical protein
LPPATDKPVTVAALPVHDPDDPVMFPVITLLKTGLPVKRGLPLNIGLPLKLPAKVVVVGGELTPIVLAVRVFTLMFGVPDNPVALPEIFTVIVFENVGVPVKLGLPLNVVPPAKKV